MKSKLTTPDDYAYAVARIRELMFKTTPSSAEGKELDQLSKLVAEYQERNDIPVDSQKFSLNEIYSRFRSQIYNLDNKKKK